METTKIILEGIDGSGKSTISKLLEQCLTQRGFSVYTTKEPGGTEVGQKIREIILNNNIDPRCELFLFLADRSQHKRHLANISNKYDFIIQDRSVLSTLCYQTEHFSFSEIYNICDQYNLLESGKSFTFILDVDFKLAKQRIETRKQKNKLDALDMETFKIIRNRYLEYSKNIPKCFVIYNNDLVKTISNILEILNIGGKL